MRTIDTNGACLDSTVFRRVCPAMCDWEDWNGPFPAAFDEGGGLKNRRLEECKMLVGHVLISRTLSVCGEVAERLKAAVC